MFKEAIDEYGKLTYRARQQAEEFDATIKTKEITKKFEFVPVNILEMKLILIEEKKEIYLNIFKENLMNAVLKTGEYNRKEKFFTNLYRVIAENIDILLNAVAVRGLPGAYSEMEHLAGNMGDFIEGVEQARELLELDLVGGPAARAAFWKTHVWPNDDLYDDTISTRMSAWGNLAPYWVLIEKGNFGKRGAYPIFSPTNFFSNSVTEIIVNLEKDVKIRQADMERKAKEPEPEIDEEFNIKEMNLFYEAQARLIQNPETYKPGAILNIFKSLENQRWYKIYITKTRKIGKRLLYR